MLAVAALHVAAILPATGQEAQDSTSPLARRVGNWMVVEANKAGDDPTAVLALAAYQGRRASGRVPLLMLRCERGKVSVFINWIDYLGLVAADVTAQLGTAPAERQKWKHATSNRATFPPGNAKKFVRSLLAVDRFTAEITPQREPTISAVFLLQGLADALTQVKDACDIG
jgi:hypothetical protein